MIIIRIETLCFISILSVNFPLLLHGPQNVQIIFD